MMSNDYRKYHNKKIILPKNTQLYPSKEALELHNKSIFRMQKLPTINIRLVVFLCTKLKFRK